MYQIEKDIPLPPVSTMGATKYPWRDLQVGDSFVMDKPIASAAAQAFDAARRIGDGLKFSCRKLEERKTRIWRTT